MNRDEQNQVFEKAGISPLARDKTYGERKYHQIFDVGLNFWVNLLASGAFTFWVKHYEKPIWSSKNYVGDTILKGKEFTNFGQLHTAAVEKLSESGFLKNTLKISTEELRMKRAESMVNVFTLQTPGHFIMIPSVIFGAKYKAAIVRYFNRKHYGDEAMESPELIARHHAIAMEERPTFMGAVMGRLGGMAINMGLSSVIGSEENLLGKLDKGKRFNAVTGGIDPTAGKLGEGIGHMAENILPDQVSKMNTAIGKSGFGWTKMQIADARLGKNNLPVFGTDGSILPYTNGVNDLSRFLAQDIMYTVSTSSTIHPVVNFFRKALPGMTYKPKETDDPEFKNLPKLRVPRNPLAQEVEAINPKQVSETHTHTPQTQEPAADKSATEHEDEHHHTHTPKHKVSHVSKENTITKRHEHVAHPAG